MVSTASGLTTSSSVNLIAQAAKGFAEGTSESIARGRNALTQWLEEIRRLGPVDEFGIPIRDVGAVRRSLQVARKAVFDAAPDAQHFLRFDRWRDGQLIGSHTENAVKAALRDPSAPANVVRTNISSTPSGLIKVDRLTAGSTVTIKTVFLTDQDALAFIEQVKREKLGIVSYTSNNKPVFAKQNISIFDDSLGFTTTFDGAIVQGKIFFETIGGKLQIKTLIVDSIK